MKITDKIHYMWSIVFMYNHNKGNKNYTKKELEKIISQLDYAITEIVHNPDFDALVEMEKILLCKQKK
ncbi:MAG: hypothetical protein J6T10_26120 [Methanobrevibacter sp.]|nr:hypothetical protein [Methanobrevibacter sp.]